MAEKKHGHGSRLYIDSASVGTYVEVAQVLSAKISDTQVGETDATTLDDSIVYYAQHTINEYSPMNLVIVWDPNTTTHATLRTLSEARTSFALRIVMSQYTTSKTWQCTVGFIQNFTYPEITSKGLMQATLTWRPQALPTLS